MTYEATTTGGSPAPEAVYQRLALSAATHFAMKFDREYMLNEAGHDVAVSKPHGMSGGPVFRLGTFAEIDQGGAQPRLVGFGIEWRKEHIILIGVRIAVVLNAIAQLCPEYANGLPKPVYFEGKASLIERA